MKTAKQHNAPLLGESELIPAYHFAKLVVRSTTYKQSEEK